MLARRQRTGGVLAAQVKRGHDRLGRPPKSTVPFVPAASEPVYRRPADDVPAGAHRIASWRLEWSRG
jgi:hypothetical protein